jgi:hypothetical protein
MGQACAGPRGAGSCGVQLWLPGEEGQGVPLDARPGVRRRDPSLHQLPESARHAEAPALFVLEPDGSKTLLNYNFIGGDTYVTDRLFEKAVLVMGMKGKERTVVLERRGERRGERKR